MYGIYTVARLACSHQLPDEKIFTVLHRLPLRQGAAYLAQRMQACAVTKRLA